jgi:hypothetical protein
VDSRRQHRRPSHLEAALPHIRERIVQTTVVQGAQGAVAATLRRHAFRNAYKARAAQPAPAAVAPRAVCNHLLRQLLNTSVMGSKAAHWVLGYHLVNTTGARYRCHVKRWYAVPTRSVRSTTEVPSSTVWYTVREILSFTFQRRTSEQGVPQADRLCCHHQCGACLQHQCKV